MFCYELMGIEQHEVVSLSKWILRLIILLTLQRISANRIFGIFDFVLPKLVSFEKKSPFH